MTLDREYDSMSTAEGPNLAARVARALRFLAAVRGWRGLVNKLVPEHAGAFTVRNGEIAFSGDIRSFIDREVYLFGGYDVANVGCFLSRVPIERYGTVLDVGANAGTHTLAFARSFESVHAFEPNPTLWPQFERNVALNKLSNVRLHKIGIGDRDADLPFHTIDKPNYGLGTFSTLEQYDLPLRAVATCPVRHGSRFLSEIGVERVDAVKIDVQGFEPEVLRGLHEVLERDRPVVWCEIGAGTAVDLSATEELKALVPFDFRCLQFVQGAGLVRRVAKLRERYGPLTIGDYVLLPR